MDKNNKNMADQAMDLLDNSDYDYKKDGDPIIYLADKGFSSEEGYELEDTIYGKPRYEKRDVHYVFADGSVLDEELEQSYIDKSDFNEHLVGLAEAAWEQHTSDFHAGDSGFPKSQDQIQREAHEQHREARGR